MRMDVPSEDNNNVCRICRDSGYLKMDEKLFNRSNTIKDYLIMCIPHMKNVTSDEYLCKVCAQELYICLRFIEKCFKSQQHFQFVEVKKENPFDDDNQSNVSASSFNVDINDLLQNLETHNETPTENSMEPLVEPPEFVGVPETIHVEPSSVVAVKIENTSDDNPTNSNILTSTTENPNTYGLILEECFLNSSTPHMHLNLQQSGVDVVNLSKDINKRKKIVLIGSTDVSNTLVAPPKIFKQIYYCIACDKQFYFPSNYIIHYITSHIQFPKEYFNRPKPCFFCYMKFGNVLQLAQHLVAIHQRKIDELTAKDENMFRYVKENIAAGSSNSPANHQNEEKKSQVDRRRRPSFWPRPHEWLNSSETSVLINCKGLFGALPQMHTDLFTSNIQWIRTSPSNNVVPKRIILLGTTKTEQISLPVKQESINCLACTKSFPEEDYNDHYMEFHSHQCVFCRLVFKYASDLRKHAIKLHRPSLHRCPKCKKYFLNSSRLRSHLRAYDGMQGCCFKCETCGQVFMRSATYKIHVALHADPSARASMAKPKLCEQCGKEFSSAALLRSHQVHVHERNKRVCPICGKLYSDMGSMRAHMKIHDPDRKNSIMCDKCPKRFSTIYNLRKHNQWKHSENVERPHCDICNKKFSPGYSIKAHKQLYHRRVCRFKCTVCNREFVRRDYLNRHMQMHEKYGPELPDHVNCTRNRTKHFEDNENTNKNKNKIKNTNRKKSLSEAPFLCKICNKVLSCASYRIHYNMHLNHRPYKCKHCEIRFTNQGSCQRHEKLHDDPTYKFSCRICFNKFTSDASLKEHMKKHNDKLQYKCKICGKRFGRRYLLENHRVNDHDDGGEKKKQLLEMMLKEVVHVIPPGKENEYFYPEMNVKNALNEEDMELKKIVNECRDEL